MRVLKLNKDQLLLRNPRVIRATRCITANVMQTKVDAQCDKLATELSWQRLASKLESRQFAATTPALNLPHLHLAPPLQGVSFADISSVRKLESLQCRPLLFA